MISIAVVFYLGAVGLNDDNQPSSTEVEHQIKREMERKKDKREKERKELHNYKETERQHIRDKYKLKTASGATPKKSSSTSPKRSPATKQSDSKEEKCSIS